MPLVRCCLQPSPLMRLLTRRSARRAAQNRLLFLPAHLPQHRRLPPPPAGSGTACRQAGLWRPTLRLQQRQRQQRLTAPAASSSSGSGGSSRGDGEPPRPFGQRLLSGLMGVAAAAALLAGTPLDVAQARTALTADERNTIQLFQRSRPSVVYITSLTTRYVLR